MQYVYLALSFLSLFALGLADNSRGPVFPDLLRDFELSDSKGALFFFITSAFSLGNNFLSSYWLPRWGAFRSLQIYLGVQACGLLVMGLAPNYAAVLVGASLFGVGMGGLGIAQNALVGRVAKGPGRMRAYSILHCMYGAASLIAPLLVSELYRRGASWPTALLCMAVPSVGCWLWSWYVKPLREAGEGNPVRARLGPDRSAVLTLAVAIGLYVMSELLVSTRIVLLARREYGLETGQANQMLTLFFSLLFVGRMSFAFVPARWKPLTIVRGSAFASLAVFAFGLMLGPSWLALAGLTMAPFFPSAMAYVHERFGARSDVALSWTLTLANLLTMVMHQGVGLAADAVGLWVAMWIGPLALMVSFGILCLRPQGNPAYTWSRP
ncbi:MAG: MFS transporter [Bdellovibrionaceae bacterium]|nr:MFS transporter [Pseudobdellovibrionaceae bacterium]